MIEIQGLSLKMENFQIENLNLSLREEAINVLLGPTGSGKTLILESIIGLRKFQRGQIIIGGKEVSKTAAREKGDLLPAAGSGSFPPSERNGKSPLRSPGSK